MIYYPALASFSVEVTVTQRFKTIWMLWTPSVLFPSCAFFWGFVHNLLHNFAHFCRIFNNVVHFLLNFAPFGIFARYYLCSARIFLCSFLSSKFCLCYFSHFLQIWCQHQDMKHVIHHNPDMKQAIHHNPDLNHVIHHNQDLKHIVHHNTSTVIWVSLDCFIVTQPLKVPWNLRPAEPSSASR